MLKALEILKDLEKLDANMIWLDEEGNGIPMQNVIEAIVELEALETKDRLAELEEVILDYYLAKGYKIGVGGWNFNIQIDSDYKSKKIEVWFYSGDGLPYSIIFKTDVKTTKEMFDKAFDYFKSKN